LSNYGGEYVRAHFGLDRSVLIDSSILTESIKVVIGGIEYQVVDLKPLKLIDDFSFEAILKRVDRTDVPENAM
jgi:hypothetical protein